MTSTVKEFIRYYNFEVFCAVLLGGLFVFLLFLILTTQPCLGELKQVGTVPVQTGSGKTVIINNIPIYKCID